VNREVSSFLEGRPQTQPNPTKCVAPCAETTYVPTKTMRIKIKSLVAFAILSSCLSSSASAGVIRSTFIATDNEFTVTATSGGSTTERKPVSTPTVSVNIYEKRGEITKIVITRNLANSFGSYASTSTITPFGSSYVENTRYESVDVLDGLVDEGIVDGQSFADTSIEFGRAKIQVRRPKGRKSSGGSVAITLTKEPTSDFNKNPRNQRTSSSTRLQTIQASLSKRPTLTYKSEDYSDEVYTYTNFPIENRATKFNGFISGRGKATGKLTP